MSGLTRGAIVVLMSALVTVGVSWALQLNTIARLESEVERVELRFKEMQKQHEKAIQAGNEAARARDEINAVMSGRARELEKILGACPDISGLELTPELREFLENACANKNYTAGVPAGPHSAARSKESQYGR